MLNAVKIVDGKAVTTSRKVAEVFEKQHKNVLLAIRELEIPEEYRKLNFQPSVYEQPNPSGGKPIQQPEYLITRDGFTILAMGFTGKKAMQFKIAYIEAFNAMEKALRNQQDCCCQQPPTVTNTPANVIESTIGVIEHINQQILSGKEVDKDVLRYAWNIGKLMGRPLAKAIRADVPDDLESFVLEIAPGIYSRTEIYDAYRQYSNNPMSARWFWPRVRKIRRVIDVRQANSRSVSFS